MWSFKPCCMCASALARGQGSGLRWTSAQQTEPSPGADGGMYVAGPEDGTARLPYAILPAVLARWWIIRWLLICFPLGGCCTWSQDQTCFQIHRLSKYIRIYYQVLLLTPFPPALPSNVLAWNLAEPTESFQCRWCFVWYIKFIY